MGHLASPIPRASDPSDRGASIYRILRLETVTSQKRFSGRADAHARSDRHATRGERTRKVAHHAYWAEMLIECLSFAALEAKAKSWIRDLHVRSYFYVFLWKNSEKKFCTFLNVSNTFWKLFLNIEDAWNILECFVEIAPSNQNFFEIKLCTF